MTPEAMDLRADGERCGTADAIEDAWSNCDGAADVFDRPRAEREAYIREAVTDSYARLNEQYEWEQASASTGIGMNGSECPPDPVFWRAVIDSYCATLQRELRERIAHARETLAAGLRSERAG